MPRGRGGEILSPGGGHLLKTLARMTFEKEGKGHSWQKSQNMQRYRGCLPTIHLEVGQEIIFTNEETKSQRGYITFPRVWWRPSLNSGTLTPDPTPLLPCLNRPRI